MRHMMMSSTPATPAAVTNQTSTEPPPKEFTFEADVFPAEWATIQARRRASGSEGVQAGPPKETSGAPVPSTKLRLVGLALSGGGIRSSTFNLGVLQGLHHAGVLRHVDYLSTVSGGGYIGSAWSALTHQPGAPFPFPQERRTPKPGEPSVAAEAPAVVHLRNNSNYLVPGQWGDNVRLPVVILRGAFLNFLLMLPYLMGLAAITAMWNGPEMRRTAAAATELFDLPSPFVVTPWLIGIYLGSLVLSAWATLTLARRARRKREEGAATADGARRFRNAFEKSFAIGAIVIAGVAFVEVQPLVVSAFHLLDGTVQKEVWAALGTVGTVGAAVLSRVGLNARFGASVALVLAGILGPALPATIYLVLAEWLVFDGAEATQALAIAGIEPRYLPGLLCTVVAAALWLYAWRYIDVNLHSGHTFWRDRLSAAFLIVPKGEDAVKPYDAIALSELNAPGSAAPYHLLNTTLNLQADKELANRGRQGDFFLFSKHFVGGPRAGFVPTAVLEAIHPHMNLGTAMAISSAAAAPNMGSYTVASARFLMTLFNVRMGVWLPRPKALVEALRIQAEDYRGKTDWAAIAKEQVKRLRWNNLARARGNHLRREMLGQLDDKHPLVNLSDGGHLENLGVYELLRRRCRYILVGDGEADGDMQFGSLSALIRFARIDLGVEIEVVLDDLHVKNDGTHGREHCALGTIRYPLRPGEPADTPREMGTLLYIKASLTGDEDSMIAQYRSASPDFPHESTADQFFSEEQFEAYRSLGFHAATTVFQAAHGKVEIDAAPVSTTELQELFWRMRGVLATNRAANGDLTRLRLQLGDVVKLASPAEVLEYYAEIYRGIDQEAGGKTALLDDGVYRRRIIDLVGRQLALMDHVFQQLDLCQPRLRETDASLGWMLLFRRWAAAPSFHWAHAYHLMTFSQGFRHFCQDALRLVWKLDWELDPTAPADQPGTLRLVGKLMVGERGKEALVSPPIELVHVCLQDDGKKLTLGEHLVVVTFYTSDTYRFALTELHRWLTRGPGATTLGLVGDRELVMKRRDSRKDDPDAWEILESMKVTAAPVATPPTPPMPLKLSGAAEAEA